jgi:predicted AAA+ superfamily ATPase
MINRKLSAVAKELITQFPSVTITGPRQSGKTTLIKETFTDYQYFNLDNPDTRLIATSDPRSLFTENKIIIDEAQRVPELFSYFQTYLDTGKHSLIISGSNQFSLNQNISQSLAGRTAMLKLLPLSYQELKTEYAISDINDLILKGFYPAIHHKKQNPSIAYRSYYETYLQKDVRQLARVLDLRLFQRFVITLAGRVGSLLNLSSVSNDVGVSLNTAKKWLSVLEASYIFFRLQPYIVISANVG